jgi:ferredoxin
MAFVIAEPCVGTKDTACVEACPVDCIHPGKSEEAFAAASQLFINADECICCGACVPFCPVSAIYAEEDLPMNWQRYKSLSAEFYRKDRRG